MRADRLPDLVNSGMLKAGKAAETTVSVRFDLSDWTARCRRRGPGGTGGRALDQPGQTEWTVTRKLRVMPGGSYSSSYSADGVTCNLQQLQTQLRRLRIDPEGSNVVMQGDVTRIVSMSNRDRRGLIDELAGVALFDTRIEQTRRKLDDVQERQERCRIIEQELLASRQRWRRTAPRPGSTRTCGNGCNWAAARRWCWPTKPPSRPSRIWPRANRRWKPRNSGTPRPWPAADEQLNKAVAELEHCSRSR